MDPTSGQIGDLLARVRARWRWLIALKAAVWAALGASGVLLAGLVLSVWTGRSPLGLAITGVFALVAAAVVATRALWPARYVPTDAQVARFIEEQDPSLDDRLVSAVDVASGAARQAPPSALAAVMLADAGRRASQVDPAAVVKREWLRRAGAQAAIAGLVLVSVAYVGRGTARRAMDAVSLAAFPASVRLDVTPGHARVQAGSALTIEARLAGSTSPASAQLQRADGEEWLATEMPVGEVGAFRINLDALAESFSYRVVVGNVTSPVFDVAVVRPPRVTRIDVEYEYPSALGLPVRTEEDGGDIYAPAGTKVTLHVHTDREAATGQMALGDGSAVPLSPAAGATLQVALTIQRDDSYRLRIADREGMNNLGDTEYFIRMLDDRPPEVRILRPARDRAVTPLEEVDIEAEAQDDFGIERLELVYAVRGRTEKVAPLDIPSRTTSVTGAHTLYLEDLDVKPGDFVSYYVRARDMPRGRRSRETRSDLFFLEVRPFDQEFSLAQSQAQGGGAGNPQLDDLVNAQKEVIVATWKLDRRAEAASGAKSAQDIRTVARAEGELKLRVEQVSNTFRDSVMRDPRRRRAAGSMRAGQTLPEEDAMTAAGQAMERAVGALQGLKTKEALPHELEALNRLLEAQASVKERQVQQQVGSGAGQNRQSQDMSTLFDKELAKQQQTNYESPKGGGEQEKGPESELDKIKELARRQDDLNQKQQALAKQRDQMSAEELKRALDTLSRDQSELRQEAEKLAQQMSAQGQRQQDRSGQQSGSKSQGQQQGQQGQAGERQAGQSSGGGDSNAMREVSEEMRSAASELRKNEAGQASARGSRALDKLRELERRLEAATPNEQRRALGDMQLEARQLADAQRELAAELARVPGTDQGKDALRRLAGEQERLAERVSGLKQNLDRQAGTTAEGGRQARDAASPEVTRAAGDAAKDLQQQRIGERMQRSAEQLREAAGQPDSVAADRANKSGRRADAGKENATTKGDAKVESGSASRPQGVAAEQDAIARALDKLADRLGFVNGPHDDESRKLTDQLAKARDLREQMDLLSRQIEAMGQAAAQSAQSGQPSSADGNGKSESGQSRNGRPNEELARLQEDYARQLKEAKDLLDERRRDERATGRSAGGVTFEGQGMVTSAPGTEAFKQDFAKWDELRRQATQALAQVESDISKRLQAKAAKDRLAAGVEDRPPAGYSQQVDRYFKAIAGKKTK